ncbi:FG-GAP-like repeat-containing protein [Streptomyces sp. NPDC001930]|uniref:FG-GAP-like repeat-containing protein n=1 Tax=Streptomyces sp. NPDC001930 TaxID=3364625 RepID=UPI00367BEDD8
MRKTAKRLLASVTGVLAGGLLAATLPAQTAQASSWMDRCPSGYFCGFSGTSGQGTMLKTSKSMATLGTWDNKIRSYTNKSSAIACVYSDPNYSLNGANSTYFPVSPNGSGHDYDASLDRTISSVKMVLTENECSGDAYPWWISDPGTRSAGFGDLDNNRRADVLSRDLAGRLWFLPGDGTGRFVGGGWNAMTAMTRHGDFTGDGREDLVTRDRAGKLWLYPGNGAGRFGARKNIGTGWNGMSALTAVGDLSGDGKADLVARDGAGKLWLYPGRGNGSFGARKAIGGGWQVMNLVVGSGDMNRDGKADLVARDSAGKLWFYPGRNNGTLGARTLIGGGWQVMEYVFAVGSYDGDGTNDLVTSTNERYQGGLPGRLLGYRGSATAPTILRPVQQLNGWTWWKQNGVF